jgi:hypothetical protein
MKGNIDSNWEERVGGLEGLDLLKTVPEPDAESWERARQAFLTEAREYAAVAVTPGRKLRRNDWRMRLRAFLSFNWRNRSMMALVKVFLALAMIVGGGTGTVYAMQNSLPGSLLYELKLDVEDARLANAGDAEERIERAMAMTLIRVEEAVRLAEKGEGIPVEVAERYQQQLATAAAAADELLEPAPVRARLVEELDEQLQFMEQVRVHLQDAGLGETAECTMVQTMQQMRERLSANQDALIEDQVPLQEQEMLQQQDRLLNQQQLQQQEQLQDQLEEPIQDQQRDQLRDQQQDQLHDQQRLQLQQMLTQTQTLTQTMVQTQTQNQNQTQTQTQSQVETGTQSQTQPEPQPQNHNQDSQPEGMPAEPSGGNGQHR